MLKSVVVTSCAVFFASLAGFSLLSLSHNPAAMGEDTSPAPSQNDDATAALATTSADHTTAIPKAGDGHFWANATVNQKAVHFLVDTGATVVVLTPADAQRLGFDQNSLVYSHKVITANGPTQAAPVILSTVGVGQSTVHNVDALVLKDGLSTSLLGMSYLGRLSRFEATPSSLILHP